MNTTHLFQDLSSEEQMDIQAGSPTSFWRDVAWLTGATIHAIVLGIEAFAGGASIVPGYVK